MKYLKALVGAVGVGLGLLAQNPDVVPERFRPYADAILALATAAGIYHAKYVPSVPKGAAGDGSPDVTVV